MTPENMQVVLSLAQAFGRRLHEQIGAEKLAMVVVRNARPEYARSCASHDFCDANMVMADAFRVGLGRDPLVTAEAGASQAAVDVDVYLWNHAWDLARASGFDTAAMRDRVDAQVVALATDAALDAACALIQAHLGEQTGDFAAMHFMGDPTHRLREVFLGYLRQQRRVTLQDRQLGGTIGDRLDDAWRQVLDQGVLQHEIEAPGAQACFEFLLGKEHELRTLKPAIERLHVPRGSLEISALDERIRLESFMQSVADVVHGILGAPEAARPRAR